MVAAQYLLYVNVDLLFMKQQFVVFLELFRLCFKFRCVSQPWPQIQRIRLGQIAAFQQLSRPVDRARILWWHLGRDESV